MAQPLPTNLRWFAELATSLRGVGTAPTLPAKLATAYRLLNHPRNAAVKRRVGGYIEVASGRRLDGLTKPLRDVFHPYHRVVSTGGAKTGGAARGTQADREIADLVNHGRIPESGHFSPYAVRILAFLRQHDLQPCASQFIVYDTDLRIATEIDLVCVDNGGRVVFVECKTGFDRNYEVSAGRLCSPFVENSALTAIEMTHRNAHQLQALAQFIIARRGHGDLVHRAVVAVFSATENSLYRISPELEAVRYDVFRNLRARVDAGEGAVRRKGAAAAAKNSYLRSLFT
jgi:hypothetical protein